MWRSTRREWLRACAALLSPRLAGALGPAPAAASAPRFTAYRADAVIVILGLPIYSRSGVGSGFADARSESDGDGVSRTFRFEGASWPERAHGLDRAGYIEETVRLLQGSLVSARYFGVMTRSAEQTAEQARKALAAHGPMLAFAAIEGATRPGARESASAAFEFPRGRGERNWPGVLDAAHRSLGAAPKRVSGNPAESGAGPAPTFLYCMASAMESKQPRLKRSFVYGDRQMWLETEKTPDARVGRELAGGAEVFRLAGTIRAHNGESLAVFRLWFEADNIVPLRIDYQPRSFLRLSFVRDAQAARPLLK